MNLSSHAPVAFSGSQNLFIPIIFIFSLLFPFTQRSYHSRPGGRRPPDMQRTLNGPQGVGPSLAGGEHLSGSVCWYITSYSQDCSPGQGSFSPGQL